ncbi:MAG: FkbM family methyltransferase [Clostridia bacterium]|nr:FkbM family methyltransferase [Clostridia bacterium]
MNLADLIQKPLWENLKNEKRPILLYGMGNGADKILACCERFGINISGVFASDGFVRNKTFHGMQIRSYSESKRIFGEDIVVLLSFATSLPDVIENIKKIASEVELYAPDVPVYGENIFDKEFISVHFDELEKAFHLMTDARSRELFTDIIKYKISGNISYLDKTDDEDDYMRNLIFAERFSSYVDAGAYKGDTILRQKIYSPHLKQIFAVEPDPSTYKKLCATLAGTEPPMTAFNCGLSDKAGETFFHGGGGRGSSFNATGKKIISLNKLDSLLGESVSDIDFIKYDVEGSEYEAIIGSSETIRSSRPSLLVSLYHRSEDLYKLPLLINEIYPDSKMYLRRTRGIPAWDINLLVVPE